MSVVFRTLTVLVIAIMAGWAWGQAVPPTGELLQMLHAGGYVIVVRPRRHECRPGGHRSP